MSSSVLKSWGQCLCDVRGFTLVELLVVISIITMLAGLLLPAINAARESGRRVQCINNQRQVAFALLNHDHTRETFPYLKAPLAPSRYPCTCFAGPSVSSPNPKSLSWVGFLLPFIEQNTAWGVVNSSIIDANLYDMVIPVLQCKSSGISPGENRISYVVNAGPLNPHVQGNPNGGNGSDGHGGEYDPNNPDGIWEYEFGHSERNQRDAKKYTIFFNLIGPPPGIWADNPNAAGYLFNEGVGKRHLIDGWHEYDNTAFRKRRCRTLDLVSK